MTQLHGPRIWIAATAIALAAAGAAAAEQSEPGPADPITLELIMAHPDWLGRAPQRPYWADDGQSFFYYRKREAEDARDLIETDLEGNVLRTVSDEERGEVSVAGGDYSEDRLRKVYSREGDLYLKNVETGEIRQLTRTPQRETGPRFLIGDTRIAFRRGGAVFVRELHSGLEYQPADLRAAKDPDDEEEKDDYLDRQQSRLFTYLREKGEKEKAAKRRSREEQRADPTRSALPWYLGEGVEIAEASLAPDEKWMIVRLRKKKRDRGKRDSMPNYVTESGYVAARDVRTKVGTGKDSGESLVLLDLTTHEKHEIDLSGLPEIAADPLDEYREQARKARKARKAEREKESEEKNRGEGAEADAGKKEKPEQEEKNGKEETESSDDNKDKPRALRIGSVTWTEDGGRLALQFFSLDRKDRWVAELDLESKTLRPLAHDHDPAWLNSRFAAIGWLEDAETLYYLSERSGYSHLYLMNVATGEERRGTEGEYEVTQLRLSHKGDRFFFTANVEHPGLYETYRVGVEGGPVQRLTHLGGRNGFVLSPDESRLLIVHSSTTRPTEVYLQVAVPGAEAARVTRTISEEFLEREWNEPEIVAIPSSHVDRPIYSRVYTPRGPAAEGKRPAVVFVHGAGYLQNSHQGWSSYFREFMFHTLLTRRGYVVLDMDYRASAGYGRDWRTAIYRRMGTPELDDLVDGVRWLAENRNVDPNRVGVYGGSYGGFLTLMGLFTKPDLFACGAALRPVTDWAHYNDGYTANILNDPAFDPDAYERSSPIEFAEGLSKPLLICHGMQDDNVFFQDTVRLAQRLIELGKQDWEVAMYPVEPHGFREPASWLDEYRRILKLFETHLKN